MDHPRSSVLATLCATGGAVAVLSSAGLVPAIGLAVGLGGGWLLGQRIKGRKASQARAQPQAEDDSDESDDEQEEALQELGEYMGAEGVGRFLARLQEQDPSQGQQDLGVFWNRQSNCQSSSLL